MPSRLQQAFDPETFRQQGRELVDRLADYLQAQLSGAGGKTLEWQTPRRNWISGKIGSKTPQAGPIFSRRCSIAPSICTTPGIWGTR
jgi:hypothetical protein